MLWVILVIIGSLIGLLVLLAILGAFLPRAHVATVAAHYRTGAAELWTTIEEMIRSERKIPMEVVDQTPPADGRAGRLITRIADPKLPFGGSWTWSVAPAGGATEVTITEDGWVSNTLFRFLARFVFGHHGTARAYLRRLGKAHGEQVAPENRT
jgi:hypothetical protein